MIVSQGKTRLEGLVLYYPTTLLYTYIRLLRHMAMLVCTAQAKSSVPCPCHPRLAIDAISPNKGLKAKATSMSLLDPTYVIEVLLPPGPGSERETLLHWTPTYKREKTSVTNWREGPEEGGNTGGVVMPNSEGFSGH